MKIDRYVNNIIKDLATYNNVFKSVFNLLLFDFVKSCHNQ